MAEIYNLPTTEMLFEEYKKAIPELIISDDERIRLENEKLKEEKSELEEIKENNQLQKDEVARQGQAIENLIQELNELKKK